MRGKENNIKRKDWRKTKTKKKMSKKKKKKDKSPSTKKEITKNTK